MADAWNFGRTLNDPFCQPPVDLTFVKIGLSKTQRFWLQRRPSNLRRVMQDKKSSVSSRYASQVVRRRRREAAVFIPANTMRLEQGLVRGSGEGG
jgi:uncharacterized protein YecT (DUF1311 family)